MANYHLFCLRLWYRHFRRLWEELFTRCSSRGVRTLHSKSSSPLLPLFLLIVLMPSRNLECLNLLLNTGADFNRKDSFGRSVSFQSARFFPDLLSFSFNSLVKLIFNYLLYIYYNIVFTKGVMIHRYESKSGWINTSIHGPLNQFKMTVNAPI